MVSISPSNRMRRQARAVVVVAGLVLGLTGGLARAQSGSNEERPAARGEILAARRGLGAVDPEQVRAWLGHPDPAVRLELARWLLVRPELDSGAGLERLVEDPVDAVAATALLALARHPMATANEVLERTLAGTNSLAREWAAVALHIRLAISEEEGLDPPSVALVDRSRTEIVSQSARSRLVALEHYRAWRELLASWQGLQHRLMTASPPGCVDRVRTNPGVLIEEIGEEGATTLPEPLTWPDSALWWGQDEGPVDLLMLGRVDDLAERRFAQGERNAELERFVTGLERWCASRWVGREHGWSTPVVVERPPGRAQHWDGHVAMGLGIGNNPVAFRPARGGFLVGEEFEVTLLPNAGVRWMWAESEAPEGSFAGDGPPVSDGIGVEAEVGGALSTTFFEDRSRPTGRLGWVWDRPATGEAQGAESRLRVGASGELSSGLGEAFFDLERFPAPQVDAEVRVERLRSERFAAVEDWDSRWVGRVGYVEHVFDDATSPPRDRRWLEPAVWGMSLFGRPGEGLRIGLRSALSARSDEHVSAVSALAGELAPMVRWRGGRLRVDLWAGGGGGWIHEGADVGYGALIGGVDTSFERRFGPVRVGFGLTAQRTSRLLGRNGRAGVVERAEAQISLIMPDAMREAIRVGLLAERGSPEDTGAAIGWAGLEAYIPVALLTLQQELAYRMRFMGVIDEARFDTRAQEYFEALLTVTARF